MSAWLHNSSPLCLVLQLCIAYGASFLSKTVGRGPLVAGRYTAPSLEAAA